jgi:hypothetical protein
MEYGNTYSFDEFSDWLTKAGFSRIQWNKAENMEEDMIEARKK